MITPISLIIIFINLFIKIFVNLLLWYGFLLKGILFTIIIGIFIFLNVFHYNPLTYNFPQSFLLNNFKTHLWNIFILLTYSMLFICGILYLRISNIEREVDLTVFYNAILLGSHTISFVSFIMALLLLLMLIILYIKLLSLLIQYVKAHLIRRHLYQSTMLATNLYCLSYEVFNDYFSIEKFYYCLTMMLSFILHCLHLKKYDNNALQYSLNLRLRSADYKYNIEFNLDKFIWHFQYTMHRLLCGIILLYDVILNDFILTDIYMVMPYAFFYEIWSRISLFYANVSRSKDDLLNTILYTKEWIEVPFSDGKEFYVGHHLVSLASVNELLHNYLFVGLVDPEFGIKKNNNHIVYILAYWERIRLWITQKMKVPFLPIIILIQLMESLI
jgi:hypothetical protein